MTTVARGSFSVVLDIPEALPYIQAKHKRFHLLVRTNHDV